MGSATKFIGLVNFALFIGESSNSGRFVGSFKLKHLNFKTIKNAENALDPNFLGLIFRSSSG